MKKLLTALLLALVLSLIHLLILVSPVGSGFEGRLIDLWAAVRGKVEPPSNVVIVAMDEQSYDILKLPMDKAWPRALHAQLLQRLKELGAKRVVFDVLFVNKSDAPEADEKLATAIGEIPTVLGADVGTKEQNSSVGRYVFEEIIEPLPLFADKAEQIALVRVPEDAGFVRRFYVPRTRFTKDIPTLFEAAAGIKPGDPHSPSPRDFLWYYGPPGTIESVPYHQVLNPSHPLPKQFFKDRVVFVGLLLRTELGPSLKDTYRASSFHPSNMFGIEIHATAAANLLEHKWVSRASEWTELTLLILAGFTMTLAIFMLRPLPAALVTVGAALVWALTSYVSYRNGFFVPGAVLTTVILPLAFLLDTFAFYIVTLRSQQQVERAFQYYLSPDMARQMKSNPKGLELGGESVFATALFTDIEGFTKITESMLAGEVSKMLNSYFTEVMEVVFENQGTLIKFIGDAVFVIWGAPLKVDDHARRACKTALAIQAGVEKFNASKRFPALHTRVGVNTGNMVVGNLGSARRFDYTAIGDSVNLASRVEGINKYFGTSILISESTKKELSQEFSPIPMGSIRVVGKSEVVSLYTLLSSVLDEATLLTWQKALLDFRARKFDEAQHEFEQVASLEPRLKAAASLYIRRCEVYRATAPGVDWSGEITFDQK